MARVIGLGCLCGNVSPELIEAVTHVEYRGAADLQSRIDAVRAKKAPMQFDPWEVIRCDQSILDPDLPSRFADIVVKQDGAGADVRRYDCATSASGPAANFSVKFIVFPMAIDTPDAANLSEEEIVRVVAQNADFLASRTDRRRILVAFPPGGSGEPEGGALRALTSGDFLARILDKCRLGLAVDLSGAESVAEAWGQSLAELFASLPLERISLLNARTEHLPVLCEAFAEGRLCELEAVTYTGSDPGDVRKIRDALRDAGATLLEDALSVSYYFPQVSAFKHGGVFDGVRYCYQALNNISEYAGAWVSRKMSELAPLLEGALKSPEMKVVGATGVIEAGASVADGAAIGHGVVIKSGAVVSDGAAIEDGAAIGANVFVAQGARVSGGRVEDNVYIGRGVSVVGPCVIRNNVWIDDGATLIRNAVVENACYVARGVVVDGATVGNRVILEDNSQILPGAYIRKDTIFGTHVVFRSEAKNTLIMDGEPVVDPASGREVIAGSEVGHYGYCGDSILGRLVNEGAGDKNSNVKNDWGEVRVNIDGWKLPSGLTKFGAIIGDFTTIGCLTVLEPGTLIGRACNVYGSKVRSWIQTATVFAEDQVPRRRRADWLPREEASLEGRSAPSTRAIREFEASGVKRITPRGRAEG